MRIGLAAGICCLAAIFASPSALAMPTKDQLAKAEKLVAEIMQSEVSAFKAKSKTAADVAAAALGYADEARTEAAKYLLLKGAFQFQVRANDYDGAAATASRLRAEISGLPDREFADILSGALRRVPRRQGGRLYAMLDRLQERMRLVKEARELTRQTRANPADKALFARLGERYVQLGDWKRAIDAFAAGEGKFAEMAQWEKRYPETGITELTTAKVADVWWDAATAATGELAAAYRLHAAYWYRKVNITCPFWLSKYKVTHGMWNAYQKVTLTKEDNALGGMKRVHCVKPEEADAFCEWLTKRYRSNLPPKYVVRLPTEAEWEYAYMANVTDPNDPHVQM